MNMSFTDLLHWLEANSTYYWAHIYITKADEHAPILTYSATFTSKDRYHVNDHVNGEYGHYRTVEALHKQLILNLQTLRKEGDERKKLTEKEIQIVEQSTRNYVNER